MTWSDTDYSSYFSYSIESIEGSENGVGAAIIPTSTTTTDYKHIFWFDAASLDSTSSTSKTYLIAFRAKASAIPTNYLPQLGVCYYATNTTSGSKWLYYSFVPSTDWEIFYTIATVPSNNYLKDITMCYCNRGISHYVDWLVAYDITGSNFTNITFGARATATNSNVLSGKTYYRDGVLYTGTMTNNGAVSGSITSQGGTYTIPSGYHSGSGKVTANISSGTLRTPYVSSTNTSTGTITLTYGVSSSGYLASTSPTTTITPFTVHNPADIISIPYGSNYTVASGYYPEDFEIAPGYPQNGEFTSTGTSSISILKLWPETPKGFMFIPKSDVELSDSGTFIDDPVYEIISGYTDFSNDPYYVEVHYRYRSSGDYEQYNVYTYNNSSDITISYDSSYIYLQTITSSDANYIPAGTYYYIIW